MRDKLKNHPFAVEAFFERSTVLTFAVPAEEAAKLIPECLELDTFNEKWAFVAAAMVQTTKLRPSGFPEVFGNSFFLIGYRIFVKYHSASGKRLRGLYILKSETDKRKMEVLGNLFTHYNYTTTDIKQDINNGNLSISSNGSKFMVEIGERGEAVSLPDQSPFQNWKEARRFAGPLPFTFNYDEKSRNVAIIEGMRQNWKPEPVRVNTCEFSFVESLGFSEVRLANAFIIENIPYKWSKGRIEQWKG
jgi:hypothetical protein